jgi:undecaprenyl pyrophosphate synthase
MNTFKRTQEQLDADCDVAFERIIEPFLIKKNAIKIAYLTKLEELGRQYQADIAKIDEEMKNAI